MTKRIALVLPDLGGGGTERVALTLTEGMLARGHEVDVVLLRAEGELLPLVPSEARIIDLKATRVRDALRPLARYLREQRPDAVQARMWPVTVLTILARMLARSRARLVVSDHGILSQHYLGSPRILAALRLSTRLYAFADARFCVSEGSADDMSRLSGISRDRFTVLRNPAPVMPESFGKGADRLWARDGPRILTVGRLKPDKNYALLIRAFAALGVEGNAELAILGEGPLRTGLEQLARDLGVADRVRIPGFTTNPWPAYASADLFVLSSDHEGYPNVILEAMLAGLPVVSTDCPSGPREILGDGRYGRLVPVGDADALAKAMAASLTEPHSAEPGRSRVRELSDDALQRYEDLLLGAS
jgi:glycosyltransferase involved in cell wall biosynthesis